METDDDDDDDDDEDKEFEESPPSVCKATETAVFQCPRAATTPATTAPSCLLLVLFASFLLLLPNREALASSMTVHTGEESRSDETAAGKSFSP
jgi:hypothetical protein